MTTFMHVFADRKRFMNEFVIHAFDVIEGLNLCQHSFVFPNTVKNAYIINE